MNKPAFESEPDLNVLGEPLQPCSADPITGFYRNGRCSTGPEDQGRHVVCSIMTEEFLAFSKAAGNDLTTPRPEFRVPGLRAGQRWAEALRAGMAPRVVLAATHQAALRDVRLEDLKRHAVDLS